MFWWGGSIFFWWGGIATFDLNLGGEEMLIAMRSPPHPPIRGMPAFLKGLGTPQLGIPKLLEKLSIRGIWSYINRRTQANQDKWPKIWLKLGKNAIFLILPKLAKFGIIKNLTLFSPWGENMVVPIELGTNDPNKTKKWHFNIFYFRVPNPPLMAHSVHIANTKTFQPQKRGVLPGSTNFFFKLDS